MSRQSRQRQRARLLAQRRRRKIWLAVAVAVVVVATSLGGYAIYRTQQPDPVLVVPTSASEDRAGVVLGTGPVTVELYSDFLCPACQAFERDARDDIDKLLAENRIRLVYRPVAILDRLSTNEYSTRSAAGAGCAADAGKLIDYAKALFDHQPAEGGPGHEDATLIRLATEAGITEPGFGQCVRDGRYLPWVDHVTDTMSANNVNGTPTVLVAGKQLQRPNGERLVSAVDAATTK